MKKTVLYPLLLCAAFLTCCDDELGTRDYNRGDGDDEEVDALDSDSDGEADTESDTFTAFVDVANICDEVASVHLSVDGVPAYSQCDDSMNSSIWSDDGVSTSAVQEDASWVRTQWSMGYQCTEFAHRYLHFVWGVTGVPNGNAGEWCDGTPPAGLVKTSVPVHGDIMVFAPGSCGASQTYGHVAVVDIVDDGNGSVNFVEQNGANRRSCAIDTAACFLHAVANDGN